MMAPQFYEILFSIIGFLFVLMLGIIGYFLKQQIKAIENLELCTNSLDKTVSLLQSNQHNFSKQCAFNHKTIDHTLDHFNVRISDNTEKINEHSEAIATLKAVRNIKTIKQ
ncbi:MAG: hypothetical protein C0397_17190 [Odoribacter sp.]|nr:hypothetical protein [Odoribacter sp.]